MADMTNLIWAAVPGVCIAIFSSWLSAHWAMKKFYSEKWWDRKERAYRQIIDALYDSIQFFAVHKEDYGQGTGLTPEKEQELAKNSNESYSALKKATDVGSFYISDKAEQVLVELRNREFLRLEDNPKFDIYEYEYQCHQKALDEILLIAKSELGGNSLFTTSISKIFSFFRRRTR